MEQLIAIADDLVSMGRAWPDIELSIIKYHAKIKKTEQRRMQQPMGSETRKIVTSIAERHGFGFLDLIQPHGMPNARTRALALARDEAIYEVFERRKLNKSHIGRLFGARDHSTICCAIKRQRARLAAK